MPPDLASLFFNGVKPDVLFVLRSRAKIMAAAIQPNFFVIYLSFNNKKLSRLRQLKGKFYAIFVFTVNIFIINRLNSFCCPRTIFFVNIIYSIKAIGNKGAGKSGYSGRIKKMLSLYFSLALA